MGSDRPTTQDDIGSAYARFRDEHNSSKVAKPSFWEERRDDHQQTEA
jgi:hypothetical protein